MRARLKLVLVAILALAGAPAFAAWSDFAPRPFENGAWLDLFGAYEEDNTSRESANFTWSDTFLREKITLFSNGYVYHPRFFQYQISLAGGLKQELYETTGLPPTGWRHGTSVEYDARLLFLPEHRYNVELFARRFEPLYKEQSATQHNSVATQKGAHFRYRQKPYFFHAGYSDDTNETETTSSAVTRLTADGQYYKAYLNGNLLSVTAAYSPSDFTGDFGLEGSSTTAVLGGFVTLPRSRLSVSVGDNTFEQGSPTLGSSRNEQFSAQEILSVELPLNFRTDLSYRVLDNKNFNRPPGSTVETELNDLSEALGLSVIQRLYRSLDTTYAYLHDDRTSTAGDSTLTSNSLSLGYTKQILGGVLLAGTSLARSETDNRGRRDIVNEPHPATPVPGLFLLGQRDADPNSRIDVSVKSPVSPFPIVDLRPGLDFWVNTAVDPFEVHVIGLPPSVPLGEPGYDLFVTYSLVSGDFVFQSDTYAYNAAVQLMDGYLLTPYYTFVAVRSKVLSGVFPGTPLDSTTYTAGLRYQRGPLRALGEYQHQEWEISPFRAYRVEVHYSGALDPTTTAYGTLAYLHKDYGGGSASTAPSGYTERTAAASGSITKELLERRLRLSAGGSYARMQSLTDTSSFSLNASLVWTIGRTNLVVGASGYGSDTETAYAPSYGRSHQYYYVRLRRELF